MYKKQTSTFQKIKREFFIKLRAFGLYDESSFFIQNLSVLIAAGMGIPAALHSVYSETKSFRMRSAIREIMEAVDDGVSFFKAVQYAGITSPHTLSLIELGELSGNLSSNLEVASLQNEKESQFRAKVRSALAYSTFVFITAIIIGIGVAWYVLPKIAGFFTDINAPLPVITRVIIAVGLFLSTYGYIFIPVFCSVFLIIFYFFFSFPKTRFIGHSILFHIPLIRKLILETEMARFGFLAGTMIEAGIPIYRVFELMPNTTTFGNYKKLYMYISDRIIDGINFKKIFSENSKKMKILPVPVRQMLIAAEQSGTVSKTLLKIGSIYEIKVETTSRNIPAFLEPTLLLVIGGIVAVLALGIMLPVYQLGIYF